MFWNSLCKVRPWLLLEMEILCLSRGKAYLAYYVLYKLCQICKQHCYVLQRTYESFYKRSIELMKKVVSFALIVVQQQNVCHSFQAVTEKR